MKASIILGTLVGCTALTLLTGCPEKSSSTATPESGSAAEPSAAPAAAPSPEKAADQEPKAAPKKEEGGW